MQKEIIIVGASGFGREIAYLLEEDAKFKIIGFVDDNEDLNGQSVLGYPILGDVNYLLNLKQPTCVAIAIGNPTIRNVIAEKLSINTNLLFPNIIAKNVRIHKSFSMGIGNIICDGNIATVNISIGNFNIINLSNTIGHEVQMGDFITIYPGCNISGNVTIGNHVEVGTGSKIIQGKTIADYVNLGAGSVVVKNILDAGVYVGVPVKKIK